MAKAALIFHERHRATAVGGLPWRHAIPVTPDNIDNVLAELPRLARLALGFAARLRRGTLDITLLDGRVIRMGGARAGTGGRR